MPTSKPVTSLFFWKLSLFVFSSCIALVACGRGGVDEDNDTDQAPPPPDPPASIRDVQAAFEAEPMRGTVYYYCDCGNGAENDCVAGNDTNTGTRASAPRRTIANAMSRLNSLTGTNTVALCKGGAFNAQARLNIDNSGCPTGNTCTDLREYTPTIFNGSAKPVINALPGNNLFFAAGTSRGGLRIMNLALRGNGTQSNENRAFFLYNGAHDIKAYNLDISGFYFPVASQEGAAESINNEFVANNFSNNYRIAVFGGGSGMKVNYNYIRTTGSSAGLDHAIYIASGDFPSYDVEIIGNDIQGQYGEICLGGIISNHGAVDGFQVKNNLIVLDANQTRDGCWGISSSNNTDATEPLFYRRSVYSGNTIINAGNVAMNITSSPNVIIENNLVINNWSGANVGISITGIKRVLYDDDISNANVIRNNTVWYGPNVTNNETRGISVGAFVGEGTGHIISNNTVSSIQSSGTLNCFRHDLPVTSYEFVNNNNCFATGPYKFEYTRGTLDNWKAYAAGFDTASIEVDPEFAATSTDYLTDYFKPLSGSKLKGAGSDDPRYKAATDFTSQTRPTPPAIGAYEPISLTPPL